MMWKNNSTVTLAEIQWLLLLSLLADCSHLPTEEKTSFSIMREEKGGKGEPLQQAPENSPNDLSSDDIGDILHIICYVIR